jgi:hypothetical protein
MVKNKGLKEKLKIILSNCLSGGYYFRIERGAQA